MRTSYNFPDTFVGNHLTMPKYTFAEVQEIITGFANWDVELLHDLVRYRTTQILQTSEYHRLYGLANVMKLLNMEVIDLEIDYSVFEKWANLFANHLNLSIFLESWEDDPANSLRSVRATLENFVDSSEYSDEDILKMMNYIRLFHGAFKQSKEFNDHTFTAWLLSMERSL